MRTIKCALCVAFRYNEQLRTKLSLITSVHAEVNIQLQPLRSVSSFKIQKGHYGLDRN